MSEDIKSTQGNIDAALHLDGDPKKLQNFYDSWAETYDADTGAVEYAGPRVAVDLLAEFERPSDSIPILDAGCGTGLVGVELDGRRYRQIDGFDLSPSMVALAEKTECYKNIQGGIDIMRVREFYADESYQVILCVGVFTLGHVPPQALNELTKLLRVGGLLVISVRKLYYDESEFQTVVDALVGSGSLVQLKRIDDAAYNKDGPDHSEGLAHYWVFRKA